MVVQIDNPANRQMHNGDLPVVKSLEPVNYLPKRQLYSNSEAQRNFNQVQMDIYEAQRRTKAPDRRKFPTILKILIPTTVATLGIFFRKDLTKFVKNLFKKPAAP